VEGRNLRSDYRWAAPGGRGGGAGFAKELVALATQTHSCPQHCRHRGGAGKTHTIPIVFAIVADPVDSGVVTSLSRAATPPVSPRWKPTMAVAGQHRRRGDRIHHFAAIAHSRLWHDSVVSTA
jgi:hypothetical protein